MTAFIFPKFIVTFIRTSSILAYVRIVSLFYIANEIIVAVISIINSKQYFFFNVTYWLNFLILYLMAPLLLDYKILLTILSLITPYSNNFPERFCFLNLLL